MAFLQSARKNIQLRVSDLARGDTKVGQVAVVLGQGWEQVPKGRRLPDGSTADGSVAVVIRLELQLYALAGTELGDSLAEDPRFVMLTPALDGKNDTLVNAANGQILGVRAQFADNAEWGEFCRSFEFDTMLQGDYFETQRSKQVVTDDEILYHLRAALAAGRFA